MTLRAFGAAGLGAVGLLLSGCATIIAGDDQQIMVTSAPGEGANCSLQNAEGTWNVTTPGSVNVQRSKTDIQVRCSMLGLADTQTVAESGFEPWTLGNLLFGGLIGLGVDWATGAIHKYPNNVQVPTSAYPAARAPDSGPSNTASVPPTS